MLKLAKDAYTVKRVYGGPLQWKGKPINWTHEYCNHK